MKFWTMLVAIMLAAGLSSIAEAKKNKTPAPASQITAIEGMKLTVSGGAEVVCDDKTTVTRNGQAAKVTDLKIGDYVKVNPVTGTATSITATTTPPPAPEPKKKKKKNTSAPPPPQITAIDGLKLTVSGGAEVVCDDKTTVTRNGQPAKIADLKVGDYATVSLAAGTATSITATTTPPSEPKKKKKNT